MQIIVFLGIVNVKFPGNTSCFLSKLKGITYFNVFKKLEDLNTFVLEFDFEN